MGWASAGSIFDPVADAMIRTGVAGEQMTEVLSVLIKALHDGDWDTDGESLGQYEDHPAIVEAFRRNGTLVHCCDEHEGPDGWTSCEEERGHEGPHKDWRGHEWARTSPSHLPPTPT
jgi:hypothetical protein